MESELKPCPWCQAKPKLMKYVNVNTDTEECYYRCPCGRARTHSALNEQMARLDWNAYTPAAPAKEGVGRG